MSLINDALKKAQRQRAEPPAGIDPMPGGGGVNVRVEKRGQAMRTQSVILIVAGAAVLVILSVVATVYLLSRPSPPPRPAAPSVVAKVPAPPVDATAPVIVLPVTAPPAIVENPVPAPAAAPAPSPVLSSPPSAISPPSSGLRPLASVPSSPPSPPTPDARIQAFVDAIRVTGIRSSGADSKVLMNDRVYRVNDLVDRTLGVRLVKVESDKLSFTDASGLVYTKNF